jgi:hypothetical protein
VFEKHGPARAKALRDYFEEASRNDYFLTADSNEINALDSGLIAGWSVSAISSPSR